MPNKKGKNILTTINDNIHIQFRNRFLWKKKVFLPRGTQLNTCRISNGAKISCPRHGEIAHKLHAGDKRAYFREKSIHIRRIVMFFLKSHAFKKFRMFPEGICRLD